ncbi:TetR/AcrR family transcriptional regulator C-terminal domain-containing protein [Morganella morganii]|nr:TetR/AcrR family transcriptional regulator C-terminal domain-containing protein [Morganella morganii]
MYSAGQQVAATTEAATAPVAPDENLPPLLREALQIMDSDDGEQAFLHSPESLIRGFEVQLTSAPGVADNEKNENHYRPAR